MTSVAVPMILKAGESRTGQSLQVFDDVISVKIAGTDTDDRYAVFEGYCGPQAGPPLHVHTREDEFFCVVEGEFRFEAAGQQTIVGPGGTVFIPRGTPHTFQNAGDKPGRLMTMVQPAGLERFFAEISAATAGAPEPDMSVVVPLFQKYGLELLGPPLAARVQAAGA